MKPLPGFLTIIIISAFCGVVTGLVIVKLGTEGLENCNAVCALYVVLFMGPAGAIVGAVISALLTYGILANVSELRMTGLMGATIMASILAVIGFFVGVSYELYVPFFALVDWLSDLDW